jgi:hypothetical protein
MAWTSEIYKCQDTLAYERLTGLQVGEPGTVRGFVDFFNGVNKNRIRFISGTTITDSYDVILPSEAPVSGQYWTFGSNGQVIWGAGGTGGTSTGTAGGWLETGTIVRLITTSQKVGIGETNPLAKAHIVGTTEQLRLGYDGNNYVPFTVASDGLLTITPVSSGATPAHNPRAVLGNAIWGTWPAFGTTYAFFGHNSLDQTLVYNYAFMQANNGDTFFNAASGRTVYIRIANANLQTISASEINMTVPLKVTSTATQLYLKYDDTYYLTWTVNNDGSSSIHTITDNKTINWWGNFCIVGGYLLSQGHGYIATVSGSLSVGFGTAASAKIHAISTTEQLRLGYDGSRYIQHTVGSVDSTTTYVVLREGYSLFRFHKYNCGMGYRACEASTGDGYNLAIGDYALFTNVSGTNNVAIGHAAGYYTTASLNVFIGSQTGQNNGGGNYNTAIGSGAGYTATAASSNVMIGYGAGYYETASNKLFIDNALRASEADGRVKALIYGVFDASPANQTLTFNASVGINVPPVVAYHVVSTSEQLRLAYDTGTSHRHSLTVDSGGTLTSYTSNNWVWSVTGGTIYPVSNYTHNLGTLDKKFLTFHAAELWVETLVAQNTIATIGGRILVAPTTPLSVDLGDGAGDTTITVKYNNLNNGDRIYLESNGKVEWMAVTSSAGGGAGAYTYTVTRSLDPSGRNLWYAGDAVVNTGTTGNGFIDLYSVSGILSGTGPTIVGNVRTGTTYSNIAPRWAIGNLNGLYGYGAVYGVAFGDYSNTWIGIDATNGFRILNSSTVVGKWDTSGNLTIGVEAASHSNVYISAAGVVQLRTNTDVKIQLSTDGTGFVGPWNFGVTAFSNGKTSLTDSTNAGVWLGTDGISLGGAGVAPPFKVTAAGALTATSATITGAITASSGSVGSFTIGTYLYSGSKTAYNDANAGVHIGSDGIGIGNNVFTVSSAGALTATSGDIAGWTLNTTTFYSGTGSNFVGMKKYVSAATDIVFFGGATDNVGTGAVFKVTAAGVLTAAGATIKTSTTLTRIEIDGSSNSIKAYDGSGNLCGTINAGSGGLYFEAGTKLMYLDAAEILMADNTAGVPQRIYITAAGILVGANSAKYVRLSCGAHELEVNNSGVIIDATYTIWHDGNCGTAGQATASVPMVADASRGIYNIATLGVGVTANTSGYEVHFKASGTNNINVMLESGGGSQASINVTNSGDMELYGPSGKSILLGTRVRFISGSTGAVTATMTNAPALEAAAPYSWIPCVANDGTECFMPIWQKEGP